MLKPRLIPCLDVRDGRVVKGIRFRGLRDAGDPTALARRYSEDGADELCLLDVSATPSGRAHGLEVVRNVRAVLDVPLTVGGGVRSVDDAAALLGAGADKVAVNSAAVARPGLLGELAETFGRQCVVLALDAGRDAAGVPQVVTHSGSAWPGLEAVAWARRAVEGGAGEVLLTSLDRDGTGEGYDLDLLRGVLDAVRVPVIASGGARSAGDLAAALEAGASAVLLASVLHDGLSGVAELKDELAGRGFPLRGASEVTP